MIYMKTILKLATMILTLFSVQAFAQSGKVQGTVTTTSGQAIHKTTISLLNTNSGSLTDSQGKYSIGGLADGNTKLFVSNE